MTTELIVMLLGIISSTTLIISALSVHRKRLLTFGIATGAVVAVQYALVGSWVGMTTLLIGLVWTVMTLLSLKTPWLGHKFFIPPFMIFHFIAFVALSDWAHMTPVSIIPLIGGWGGVIAIFFKDVVYTKMSLIGVGGMWLTYELHMGMYGQMIGESLNMVANTAALITLLVARSKGIPDILVDDVDRQLLDVFTGSFPAITESTHLPRHVYVPVRGAHPHSVHYARAVEEYHGKRESNTATVK